jgi:hypothetical protein
MIWLQAIIRKYATMRYFERAQAELEAKPTNHHAPTLGRIIGKKSPNRKTEANCKMIFAR